MNLIPKKLYSAERATYEGLMKQPWKFDLDSDITKTPTYNNDLVEEKLFFPSIELFRVVGQWIEHLQQIIADP
jgi:hypothetical protein